MQSYEQIKADRLGWRALTIAAGISGLISLGIAYYGKQKGENPSKSYVATGVFITGTAGAAYMSRKKNRELENYFEEEPDPDARIGKGARVIKFRKR